MRFGQYHIIVIHGALIYGSAVTEQRLLANSVDEKRKGRPTEQADLRFFFLLFSFFLFLHFFSCRFRAVD